MKTIKQLTKDYQESFKIWLDHNVKGAVKKRGRKKKAVAKAPNYLLEVIVPIITELARKMPDHLAMIPDPETYGIGSGNLYPIIIAKKMIGGLSYLNFGEDQLYFTPVVGRKTTACRLPVNSMKQLENIVRDHLATLNGRLPKRADLSRDGNSISGTQAH